MNRYQQQTSTLRLMVGSEMLKPQDIFKFLPNKSKYLKNYKLDLSYFDIFGWEK